jgi:hypothetical protein
MTRPFILQSEIFCEGTEFNFGHLDSVIISTCTLLFWSTQADEDQITFELYIS